MQIRVECTWQMVLLSPKGNRNFQVVGLVEVIWKMVSVIINREIGTVVWFHEILHGLLTSWKKWIDSLKSKTPQHMMKIREEVLYNLFLDLQKVYDALNRQRCIEFLIGCGVISCMEILILHY